MLGNGSLEGVSMSQIGKLFVMSLLSLQVSGVAFALDFDSEIHRQEKVVKINYQRPPHHFSAFLKFYPECKIHQGTRRARCNIAMAKKRFYAYRDQWFLKNRQLTAQVEPGQMEVMLTPKAERRNPTASY